MFCVERLAKERRREEQKEKEVGNLKGREEEKKKEKPLLKLSSLSLGREIYLIQAAVTASCPFGYPTYGFQPGMNT